MARMIVLASFALQLAPAPASARQLAPPSPNVVIKSQYRRLPFTQDIQRIAVADTKPGQAKGQALNLNGGLWYVLSPSGKVIRTK